MNIKHIFIILLLPFLISCSNLIQNVNLEENKNFYIYDNINKKNINYHEFIDTIYQCDIILLGEEHDQLKHHKAQSKILQDLTQLQNYNIAFEMLASTEQKNIDNTLKNRFSIKKSNIKKELNWDKKWHYDGYDMILESIFYTHSHISGANLSKEEINTIYNGALDIQGFISNTTNVKNKIKQIIKDNHNQNIDETLLNKLVSIQQYKDRRMADVLAHSKLPSILIAGKYHCDKNIGVPLHIQDFKSNKKTIVILFEDEKNAKELDDKHTDFIWIFKH